MKMPSFRMSWDTTASTARLAMTACAATSLVSLCLTVKLLTMHERIMLVPPNMTTQAQVAWESASESYYKGWGMFVSSMIGSVTPRTAAFTAKQLEPLFDAPLWPRIATQIMSIADDPNYAHSGMLNVFTPRTVLWESSTAKIFVSGLLDTTAYRNSALPVAELSATYEMRFEMRNGLPKIVYFNSYSGEPRTLKWMTNHKGDPSLAAKPASQKSSILPQESEIEAQLQKQQAAELAVEASDASAAASAAVSTTASAAAVAAAATNATAATNVTPDAAPHPGGTQGVAPDATSPATGASAAAGAHL